MNTGEGGCWLQTVAKGGSIYIPHMGVQQSASCSAATPQRRLGFDTSERLQSERWESYPHLSINPVCKYCHVSVHSWSVSLGTAGSPARVPNQPPDAALQSDQRTATVTLRNTAKNGEQNFKPQLTHTLILPRGWGVGRGASVGVTSGCAGFTAPPRRPQ